MVARSIEFFVLVCATYIVPRLQRSRQTLLSNWPIVRRHEGARQPGTSVPGAPIASNGDDGCFRGLGTLVGAPSPPHAVWRPVSTYKLR